MLKPSGLNDPQPVHSKKKLASATQKTMHSILRLMSEAFFSEKYSRRTGWLQRIDPRTKLISAVALLVTLSLVRSVRLIWATYAFILILAISSRIEFWFFLKRVWLLVPFATGVIVLPALLDWVTPGRPLVVLHYFQEPFQLGPWSSPRTLAISENGVRSALLFVSRVGVSVSIVVLLTLTTTWQRLLRSLRVLGVPQFFVFILGMTYRYIQLFLSTLLDMHLGKKSRTLRASPSQEQTWAASRMGYLFRRSHHLGEKVYSAMLSRGFLGEPRSLEELQWRRLDSVMLAVCLGFCAGTLIIQSSGL
jgi:cobalt/nickel transport system permease protein